jgi:hypothetical protein
MKRNFARRANLSQPDGQMLALILAVLALAGWFVPHHPDPPVRWAIEAMLQPG